MEKNQEENKVKYIISCEGGLFNQIQGIKVSLSDSKLLDWHSVDDTLNDDLWTYRDKYTLELPPESGDLQREIQQIMYEGLISVFGRVGRRDQIFMPKIMPQDYFNNMVDDMGILIRIVDKYGENHNMLKFENIFPREAVLEFHERNLDGFLVIQHPFNMNRAYLQSNEELRRQVKITIWTHEYNIYTKDPSDPKLNNIISLDPFNGEITGATIAQLTSFTPLENLGEEGDSGINIWDPGLILSPEVLASGELNNYPKVLAKLNEAKQEVKRIIDYLKTNYTLESSNIQTR